MESMKEPAVITTIVSASSENAAVELAQLSDIENNIPTRDSLKTDAPEARSHNCCVAFYQSDRDRLADFYAHWPREFTALGAGHLQSWSLMIERSVFGIASLAILFWSIGENHAHDSIEWWMIFLTNWILLFSAIHWVGWIAVTYLALRVPASERCNATTSTPLFARAAMWSQSTALSVNCIVTLLYWFLLFPDEDKFYVMRAFTHGGTFLLVLIDAIVSRQQLFFSHMFFPFAFGVAWVIFSVIYWAAGGTDKDGGPIYGVVDWEDEPGSAAVLCLIVAFVVLPIIVSMCAGLSRLWTKCCV